jgi:Putative Se/S carrier protein-like
VGFFNLFKKEPAPAANPASGGMGAGILVFASTSEVIKAERVLKAAGWAIRVMGPPPEIQTGCDLVIEFPLVEKLRIVRTLEESRLSPLQVVPVNSPLLKPVDLFQVKDFGAYLMVRAANMKLTIDKASRRIVNVSGGGCPDVPYLAQKMVGRTLENAPMPRDIGHTLCGYALQLAYEEMQRLCSP